MICHKASKRRCRERGVSLIEGMVASGVLLIGMIGVFQGLGAASKQNALAEKVSRQTAVAKQMRMALQNAGREQIKNRFLCSGNWVPKYFSPSEFINTGGANSLTDSVGTWKDDTGNTMPPPVAYALDAQTTEMTATTPAAAMVPGYVYTDDYNKFQRYVIWQPSVDFATACGPNAPTIERLLVVVTSREDRNLKVTKEIVILDD